MTRTALQGSRRALVSLALLLGCSASLDVTAPEPTSSASRDRPAPLEFEFLGEATLASTGTRSAPIGGLSGITYDREKQVYYAISDDPASRGPARFYTLTIDLIRGSLAADGVEVRSVTPLLDGTGAPFAPMSLDAEGIALTPEGNLAISSEGQVRQGVAPFLGEFGIDGRSTGSFPLAERHLPDRSGSRGIRHNLGFESAAVSFDGRWFYSSTENALVQDGVEADVGIPSSARILRYQRSTGALDAEYVYEIEPVAGTPPSPTAFRTRGLVDLLSGQDSRFFALEREYVEGVGNRVDLYQVDFEGATDVQALDSLVGAEYRPVGKKLVLASDAFEVELDNLEGLTFGPRLPDGRLTLIFVSDDNFSASQRNQVLAFAIREAAGHAAMSKDNS